MRQPYSALLVLTVASAALACSATQRNLPRNALVVRARAGYEPAPTARGLGVVAYARRQLGHRYCWGGTGPSCFDCSGLASTAWNQVGVRIPRTADRIATSLLPVRLEEIRAGDILWWPGHVGLYVGNGWLIDALDSRHGVVVRPAIDPYGAVRPSLEVAAPTLPNAGGLPVAPNGPRPTAQYRTRWPE